MDWGGVVAISTAVVAMSAAASRIIVCMIALRGVQAEHRPAIIRAVAALFRRTRSGRG